MKTTSNRKPTTEERAALDVVAAMADSKIDTSDMPEVTDWRGSNAAARVTRPGSTPRCVSASSTTRVEARPPGAPYARHSKPCPVKLPPNLSGAEQASLVRGRMGRDETCT